MNYSLASTLTPKEIKRFDSVRILTRLLLFSGLGNCACLLLGCYSCFAGNFWLPPHHLHQAIQLQSASPLISLRQAMHHFQQLSLLQLVESLSNTDPVTEGYRLCDLALGYLVKHHHFDLARATQGLISAPLTELLLPVDSGETPLTLYLGLTPEHYDAILAFGRREQWPLQPEALFSLLKASKTAPDRSLKEAFCLCLPFQVLQKNLLGGANSLETAAEEGWNLQFCLDRILEGDFQQFMHSCRAVAQQTGSIHLARQTFLAYYPADKDRAKLEISPVHTIAKVEIPTSKVEPIAKPKQVASTQTVANFKTAPQSGVTALTTTKPALATLAVAPAPKSVKTSPKSSVSAATYSIPKLYVVRSGDSLWKIARAFEVDIDKIKSCNALTTDALKPGSSLMIP